MTRIEILTSIILLVLGDKQEMKINASFEDIKDSLVYLLKHKNRLLKDSYLSEKDLNIKYYTDTKASFDRGTLKIYGETLGYKRVLATGGNSPELLYITSDKALWL